MESTIKKVFRSNVDEETHQDFIKFGRGMFNNRYLIDGKKQKDKWNIKTSAEYANYLVKKGLERAEGRVMITGAIITTKDLRGVVKFPIERIKQFAGVKQAIINTEVSPEELSALINEIPKAFYALSYKLPGYELKIKAKAPKSGKPSPKGEGEVKADFCTLKTDNKEVVEDLVFDYPTFKEVSIKHTINIEEIIIPKGITDPVQLREASKRKGTIVRILKVDGQEFKEVKNFEA